MGRIIAIANQKGGVGKTTTAVNLATALAALSKRVLLIDLDPQGNASTGLGIADKGSLFGSAALIDGDKRLADCTHKTEVPGLFIVPSSLDLAATELTLGREHDKEFKLKRALADGIKKYDCVFIDCPPALGSLTLNALVAADDFIVPLQCEFYALEGLTHLMRIFHYVRNRLNPTLNLCGILLTMFDGRNNLSGQVAEDVRRHFGSKVFTTLIPRNVRLGEAPSHGKPAVIYDNGCSGSRAYVQLAAEFVHRTETAAMSEAP